LVEFLSGKKRAKQYLEPEKVRDKVSVRQDPGTGRKGAARNQGNKIVGGAKPNGPNGVLGSELRFSGTIRD